MTCQHDLERLIAFALKWLYFLLFKKIKCFSVFISGIIKSVAERFLSDDDFLQMRAPEGDSSLFGMPRH